jgi:hypothetical protein
MIEEVSTDDPYEEIPDIDEKHRNNTTTTTTNDYHNSSNMIGVEVESPYCTTLTVRTRDYNRNDNDDDVGSYDSFDSDELDDDSDMESIGFMSTTSSAVIDLKNYQQLMTVHQHQQKILSLVHLMLPFTNAVVLRRHRHIAARKLMMSSVLWFSMMLWPNVMRMNRFQNNYHSTTTTVRAQNPTTLFRR